MTKLTTSKTMTQAELFAGVAQQYKTGGGKTAMSIIAKALDAYAKTAVKVHIAACVGLFHAAETGDTRPLTAFFDGIRQNDRDALRLWVGKRYAKITVREDEDDETGTEKSWITFNKDKGFVIVKGTENIRKGYFSLERMLADVSFQDMDQTSEAKTIGLAEILAMLAKVQKSAEKKADENGVALPKALQAELAKLTAVVASIPLPTAGATA